MTIGIYALMWDDFPDKVYVGKSQVNCHYRYKRHLRALKNGTHHSSKLQDMYNKLNKYPQLVILEICKIEQLLGLEEYYIKELDSYTTGLNMTNGGYAGYGTGGITSKFSKRQILVVFSMLCSGKYSREQIARRSKVSTYIINDIRSGRGHLWLSEEYPDAYYKLRSTPQQRRGGKHTLQKRGIGGVSFVHKDGRLVENIDSLSDFIRSLPEEFSNFVSAKNNLSSVSLGKTLSYKGWKKYDKCDDR